MTETALIKRDKYCIYKINSYHYKIILNIHNKKYFMNKLCNFNLLELMYKLNADNYEQIQLTQTSNNEAELFLILKSMFGLDKKQGAYHIQRIEHSDNHILFQSKHSDDVLKRNFLKKPNLSPVYQVDTECFVNEPHTMTIVQNIYFFKDTPILPMLETIFIKIVKTSTKKFIAFLEAM